MILVGGLSPAWQQIMQFERILPGEVNRADDVLWCASGKVLNVALALGTLQADARTVSPIGGLTGEAIRAEFDRLGIAADWVTTTVSTRVCTTLLDKQTGRTTELVENSPPIQSAELQAFRAAFRQYASTASTIILTGSLPAGTPPTYFRELLAGTTAKTVLDIRGLELQEALASRPTVVKPNREELGMTVGYELTTDEDLLRAMKQLNAAGAEWVIVSQGPERLLASSRSELYEFQPPTTPVVNPIGCGDCLTAGMAYGLEQGRCMTEAIALGIAAASQNVQQLLPARLDRDGIEELAASIRARPV